MLVHGLGKKTMDYREAQWKIFVISIEFFVPEPKLQSMEFLILINHELLYTSYWSDFNRKVFS